MRKLLAICGLVLAALLISIIPVVGVLPPAEATRCGVDCDVGALSVLPADRPISNFSITPAIVARDWWFKTGGIHPSSMTNINDLAPTRGAPGFDKYGKSGYISAGVKKGGVYPPFTATLNMERGSPGKFFDRCRLEPMSRSGYHRIPRLVLRGSCAYEQVAAPIRA